MTYQPPMPPTNNREALIWLIGQEIFDGGASDVWERAAAILDSPLMAAYVKAKQAEALRVAAKDWDRRDPASLAELSEMANQRYQPGGPSMPSIWLEERADALTRLGVS